MLTELREFDTDGGPLTELHYQTGDNGLQRVTALHAQELSNLVPDRARLQVLFGYAGAAVRGEYPGSRLQRMRQLLLRTRLQQPGWSLELMYLHNQRRLGAHSGVQGSAAIRYNRLIATVLGREAQRRDVRNDWVVTAKAHMIPGLRVPLVATMSASNQTLRYRRDQQHSVEAVVWRGGGYLYQDIEAGLHRLRILLEGWVDTASSAAARVQGKRRSELQFTGHDVLRWEHLEIHGSAGLHYQAHVWGGRGSLGVRFKWSDGHLFAEVSRNSARFARIQLDGWEDYVKTISGVPGVFNKVHVGAHQTWGVLDVAPFVFFNRESEVADYIELKPDSIAVERGSGQTAGAGLRIGFRLNAQRGFYAEASPWIMHTSSTISERVEALPNWAGSARVGLRYVLFTGDLDLNLSVRGRWWGRMYSRVLHAPTGLLVLTSPERPYVPSSGTIDINIEGRVRTATLFVAFENVLSGTTLLLGNEIIPAYPLPSQKFRFGVYWPIIN